VHIADIAEGIFDAMTRKMKAEGFLAENFCKFFNCALLTHD
jgi:hypothetical protein